MKKTKVNARNGKQPVATSATNIQQFFKPTAKPSAVVNGNASKVVDETTESVYIQFLKSKLRDGEEHETAGAEWEECPNEVVIAEPDEHVEQSAGAVFAGKCSGCKGLIGKANEVPNEDCFGCKDWEKKYKDLKKEHMKMGTCFAELQMKHNELLQTKTYTDTDVKQQDINEEVPISSGIFTSNEIKVLQSMSLERKTDSTFILSCLKFAYKEDMSVLRARTLYGTPESMTVSKSGDVTYVPAKDPLSPPKIKLIRQLFVQRIDKCRLRPAAFEARIKEAHMNKLIASGITNLGKKSQ